MVTVREVFDYAVETDMLQLAHRVYWAISKQLVMLTDDSVKLDSLQYNDYEINGFVEKNLLGIGRIKLYVIQTQQAGWFAFYLAQNSMDAHRLHSELFRETKCKVTRSDRLLIPLMYFADTGKEENLYEYRKRVVEYPNYLGHAKAGEHVLYKQNMNINQRERTA